ncbi:DNA inteRNAlization/competence protein comec/rec2 [Anaeramoeba flamelloides]|uniref:DNA inteRNAlization/competence protein comec/rec2 n=1 Tax=Anaeramoeba flamelloides TaxID=1746091 RepID=A0AAV7YZ34_9EUKA|nr:DNA inteRNAlization/competence protein comec/rec2 [Anaeramoeba flamelloides]
MKKSNNFPNKLIAEEEIMLMRIGKEWKTIKNEFKNELTQKQKQLFLKWLYYPKNKHNEIHNNNDKNNNRQNNHYKIHNNNHKKLKKNNNNHNNNNNNNNNIQNFINNNKPRTKNYYQKPSEQITLTITKAKSILKTFNQKNINNLINLYLENDVSDKRRTFRETHKRTTNLPTKLFNENNSKDRKTEDRTKIVYEKPFFLAYNYCFFNEKENISNGKIMAHRKSDGEHNKDTLIYKKEFKQIVKVFKNLDISVHDRIFDFQNFGDSMAFVKEDILMNINTYSCKKTLILYLNGHSDSLGNLILYYVRDEHKFKTISCQEIVDHWIKCVIKNKNEENQEMDNELILICDFCYSGVWAQKISDYSGKEEKEIEKEKEEKKEKEEEIGIEIENVQEEKEIEFFEINFASEEKKKRQLKQNISIICSCSPHQISYPMYMADKLADINTSQKSPELEKDYTQIEQILNKYSTENDNFDDIMVSIKKKMNNQLSPKKHIKQDLDYNSENQAKLKISDEKVAQNPVYFTSQKSCEKTQELLQTLNEKLNSIELKEYLNTYQEYYTKMSQEDDNKKTMEKNNKSNENQINFHNYSLDENHKYFPYLKLAKLDYDLMYKKPVNGTYIYAFNVEGDFIAIQTEGIKIVIDLGFTKNSFYFLKRFFYGSKDLHRGKLKIDLLILTHDHQDHLGPFYNTKKRLDHIENFYKTIDVSFIIHSLDISKYDNPILNNSNETKILVIKNKSHDIGLNLKSKGYNNETGRVTEGSITINCSEDVLIYIKPPLKTRNKDENENSLSLILKTKTIENQDFYFLSTGDLVMNKDLQNWLEQFDGLNIDVIKIPHHGSTGYKKNNQTKQLDLIKLIEPRYIIVTHFSKYELPGVDFKNEIEQYDKDLYIIQQKLFPKYEKKIQMKNFSDLNYTINGSNNKIFSILEHFSTKIDQYVFDIKNIKIIEPKINKITKFIQDTTDETIEDIKKLELTIKEKREKEIKKNKKK